MNTCFGLVADELGLASNGVSHWQTRPDQVAVVQDDAIPIDYGHTPGKLGEIIHLEIGPDRGLWAVGHLDSSFVPEVGVVVGQEHRSVPVEMYWSPTRIGGGDEPIRFIDMAITPSPARVCPKPIRFLPGALDFPGAHKRWNLDGYPRRLLEHACAAHIGRRRNGGGPLVVVSDKDGPTDPDRAPSQLAHRSASRIEIRAAEVCGVSESQRSLDVIVMPYESPTTVVHQGRVVREIVARGAFADIDRGGGRVKVNRDHNPTRPVGKAVAFNPDDDAGLWARLRIARTPAGDETLALAEDGILDISAGFGVPEHGESWPSRNVRLLRKVFLDHIAMVSNPAYSDARVLAVRDDDGPLAG